MLGLCQRTANSRVLTCTDEWHTRAPTGGHFWRPLRRTGPSREAVTHAWNLCATLQSMGQAVAHAAHCISTRHQADGNLPRRCASLRLESADEKAKLPCRIIPGAVYTCTYPARQRIVASSPPSGQLHPQGPQSLIDASQVQAAVDRAFRQQALLAPCPCSCPTSGRSILSRFETALSEAAAKAASYGSPRVRL